MEGLVLRKSDNAPVIHTDDNVDLDDMFNDEDDIIND